MGDFLWWLKFHRSREVCVWRPLDVIAQPVPEQDFSVA